MLSRDIWIRHAIRVTPDSLGYPHHQPYTWQMSDQTNRSAVAIKEEEEKKSGIDLALELFHFWSSSNWRKRYIIKMIRIMFYHGRRMQGRPRCTHPCVDNCISYRWLTLCDLSKQPDVLPLLSKHYILLISPISRLLALSHHSPPVKFHDY